MISKNDKKLCISPQKGLLLKIEGQWYRFLKKHRITSFNEEGGIDKVEFTMELCQSKVTEEILATKQVIEVTPQKQSIHTYDGVYSKNGVACMWEAGGGFMNTGFATLIANGEYRKKKPIYVKTSGPRACEQQALVAVRVGHIICSTTHHSNAVNLRKLCFYTINIIYELIAFLGIFAYNFPYPKK